jgi:hypothetical protein
MMGKYARVQSERSVVNEESVRFNKLVREIAG